MTVIFEGDPFVGDERSDDFLRFSFPLKVTFPLLDRLPSFRRIDLRGLLRRTLLGLLDDSRRRLLLLMFGTSDSKIFQRYTTTAKLLRLQFL